MYFIKKMQDIADSFSVYDQKKEGIAKDWERSKAEAEQTHKTNSQNIQNRRNSAIDAANKRKKDWDNTLSQSKKHMQNMQSSLLNRMYFAANGHENSGLSEKTFVGSLQSLQEMKKSSFAPHFKSGDNDELISIARRSDSIMSRFHEDAEAIDVAIQEQHDNEVSYAQRLFASQSAQEEARYTQYKTDAQTRFQQQQTQLHNDLGNTFQSTLDPKGILENYNALTDAIPDHDSYAPVTAFPEQICFGYAGYEVTNDLADPAKKEALNSCCGYMAAKEGNRTYLKFPYGYSFTDSRFSSMFEFNKDTRTQTLEHMKSLVLRLMMSTPCGKAWLTFIDPLELGKTFSMFTPWGEIQRRVIDNQPWYDETNIEERLDDIITHTGNINKNCLQGRYENILEYNKSAGKNAEPLRFLVIADFPHRFSSTALDKLETIITQGPSTGVFVLIAADVQAMEMSMNPTVQRIREKINIFSLYKGFSFTSDIVNNRPLRFMPMICTNTESAFSTISKIGDGIKKSESIVILPEDIFPSDMQFMSYDASNGICVPIGLEGANKRIEVQLGGISDGGGEAHTYHAMIGGDIGSGKSSLLNNIITAIMMSYSPNEVQLYVVDMKDGIEFKRYASHLGLANLRVVAVDAEKEFAQAVFEELVREKEWRSQIFKENGTDRIETYNKKMRAENKLDRILPRIIFVMDEVQVLFDSQDDPITKKCADLVKELVLMGGSAYGIQLIFATQDWANVEGIAEGVYAMMGVRIALKSGAASASRILTSDNEYIDRLASFDIGKAVFNKFAGKKDLNHEFRSAYYSPEATHAILDRLEDMQESDYTLRKPTNQRLLSSNVADHADHPLNLFAQSGTIPMNYSLGYRLWIGESVDLINTYYPSLNSQNGQNLLLVGSTEATAANISAFAAMSVLLETLRVEGTISQPIITLFDYSNPIQAQKPNLLQTLVSLIPNAFRVFRGADLMSGLSILENEIDNADDASQHFVIFFGLNRARRLTEGSTYSQKPRDTLAKLLREGPHKGTNFIVWANSPSMFQQFYSDTLSDFEQRLVFEKTDDDLYPFFVQDKKPVTANDRTAERNALSYNLDGDNQIIKLYKYPTEDWLNMLCNEFKKHMR